MPGLEELNKTIERFEKASETLREETRIAHQATKDVKAATKAAERVMKEKLEQSEAMIEQKVVETLKEMEDRVAAAAQRSYDKVQEQIGLVIDLSLGKRLTRSGKAQDLRPIIAAKLNEWLMEELSKVGIEEVEEDGQ